LGQRLKMPMKNTMIKVHNHINLKDKIKLVKAHKNQHYVLKTSILKSKIMDKKKIQISIVLDHYLQRTVNS